MAEGNFKESERGGSEKRTLEKTWWCSLVGSILQFVFLGIFIGCEVPNLKLRPQLFWEVIAITLVGIFSIVCAFLLLLSKGRTDSFIAFACGLNLLSIIAGWVLMYHIRSKELLFYQKIAVFGSIILFAILVTPVLKLIEILQKPISDVQSTANTGMRVLLLDKEQEHEQEANRQKARELQPMGPKEDLSIDVLNCVGDPLGDIAKENRIVGPGENVTWINTHFLFAIECSSKAICYFGRKND